VTHDSPGPDPIAWDAARLALLALRGNIHPSRTLTADAYAILPERVVRTADATVPRLVAAPKPLVCGAYASGGVVMIRFAPPTLGGLERSWFFLAAERVEWNASNRETPLASSLGKLTRRRADDAVILCAAREERILYSEQVIARWERDYAIVACSLFVDDVDDRSGPESTLRTDARARSAAGVLGFGRFPPA
jgi:hypothetical protein